MAIKAMLNRRKKAVCHDTSASASSVASMMVRSVGKARVGYA
jgi:hypothetical protein